MAGFMYILKCANDTFYVGSTKNLIRRFKEHQNASGANHTKRYGPVELVYFEIYQRIDFAYYREKQIQGWTRKKKQALINGEYTDLKFAAKKIFRMKL
jgi:putative endonuclease